MRKIFEEYGGVIITVIAVVCLIALVTFLMSSNGAVSKAFTDIVNKFVGASSELLDSSVATSSPVEIFYKQNPKNLSFRSSAPIEELQTVKVNGEAIDGANYTLSDEGTTITLKVEYLGTLPEGTYTVKVESESGSLTVTFKVVAGGSGSGEQGGGQGGDQGGASTLPESGVNAETREITDSWEQIKQAIDEGLYASRYQLGDTKTFTMEEYGDVVMQIVAFDADDKADGSGKAAISWVSKGVVMSSVTMNTTMTNENGWAASKMRSWLQGDFYASLPDEVKAVIVSVNKAYYDSTSNSTKTCDDSVWIPSYREVVGIGTGEASGADYTAFFKYNASRVKLNSDGRTWEWWLRSAESDSGISFRTVSGTGHPGKYYANEPSGLVLGFCM